MIFWRCDNEECEASRWPERPVALGEDGKPDPEALVCALCQNEHKPETLSHRPEPGVVVVEPEDDESGHT